MKKRSWAFFCFNSCFLIKYSLKSQQVKLNLKEEVSMDKNELIVDNLKENHLLVSDENEHFLVDKELGKNILCCEKELAFLLRSLDHRGKEVVIISKVTPNNQLVLTGFKAHRYHD
jgi:hypothetical protein